MSAVLDILKKRYACKKFNSEKKLSKDELNSILEAGRLSPSSFGLEQWRFIVVKNQKVKEKLKAYCWNQSQITDCSDLIILLAMKDLKSSSSYVKEQLSRRDATKEQHQKFLKIYSDFIDGRSENELMHWSMKQCYIAGANMMTVGTSINVDSCPIEGFEKARVEDILKVDLEKYEVAFMIAFGFSDMEQPKKLRLDLNQIVQIIE